MARKPHAPKKRQAKPAAAASRRPPAPAPHCERLSHRPEVQKFLFDVSMAANAIIAPDLTLLEVNGGFAQAMGFDAQALVGQSALDYVAPEQQALAREMLQAIFQGGESPAMEMDLVGPRGRRTFWFVEGHVPIVENGKIVAIALSGIDITTRKQAEHALRQSEEKYRTLAESAGAYIAIVDESMCFTYANSANDRNFEVPASSVIGKSIYEAFPAAVATAREVRLRECFRSGKPQVFEESSLSHGKMRTFSTSFQPLQDTSGKTVAVMVVALDLTEDKRMRKELWDNQQRLENMLNSLHETAMGMIDRDGTFLAMWCGEELERRYNMRFRDLVGKRVSDMPNVTRSQAAARVQLFREIMDTGRIHREETLAPTPGGPHWQDTTISPLRDPEGKAYAVLLVARDITRRKQMEEALRASESRYRGLVESQTDLVVRVDLEGRFTFVNDAYCRTFGKTREQLLGSTYTPLVHPDDVPAALETVKAVMKPPHRAAVEQRAMTAAGWRWIAWEDCAILDDAGRVVEIQAVGRDVTANKQAQVDLEQAHRKLMDAREHERRRLAMELHDSVSQSLVAMQIQMKRSMHLCPKCPNSERLDRTSQRCAEIVVELRQLCQGLYPPTLDDLGLPSALKRLAQDVSGQMQARVTVAPDLVGRRFEPHIEIALFRIAQEAVTNAVRHSAGTRLSLTLGRQNGSLLLRVRDNGKGFDAATTMRGGLGLTSIRERAHSIDAKVTFASRDTGTSIEIRMPLPPERRK